MYDDRIEMPDPYRAPARRRGIACAWSLVLASICACLIGLTVIAAAWLLPLPDRLITSYLDRDSTVVGEFEVRRKLIPDRHSVVRPVVRIHGR